MAREIAVPAPGTANKLGPSNTSGIETVKGITLKYLRPHTEISNDFDELKFHAAASRQLQWQHDGSLASGEEGRDTRLIASPYNDVPHLLDLETLDTQSRFLALALASFRSVRDDYATAPYIDNFNWNEVFGLVKAFADVEGHIWKAQTFYVVAFRSILLPGADNDHLHALDAYSHQEAVASGGLLKYWFGTKDEKRQNLATCIWRSREDARLGGRGPWHAKAIAAARELYEKITFTTMKLIIEDDVKTWSIGDWKDSA
ncbi:hypothetical protein N7532_005921 [Penicillium argentinense]|uniref:Uncharacterized protein n=1 Tax=Penicillium argentinense TaxID=1131581 RepID=A0A9W9FF37_9EURO|nr:uncharacterized protein N7532_005921 [Penicillium argentinense]KAJ5098920.1 hypothetical protein N7532_005921 [Penicillium argentinense]